MRLDIYVKQMINGASVQKLLDALKILDEETYNQILDDGLFECFGSLYSVDRTGKVAWR